MSSPQYKKFRPLPLQLKKEVEDTYIPVFPIFSGINIPIIEETSIDDNATIKEFSPVSFQSPESFSSLSSLSSIEELSTLKKLNTSRPQSSPKRRSPVFTFDLDAMK